MEQDFWLQRWQDNEIGFHEGSVNVHLQTHWQTVAGDSNATVLVPLCGKAVDLVWLRQRGHRVIGVELSEIACRSFFQEQGLTPEIEQLDAFQHFSVEGLTLLCGDFFQLRPDHVADAALLYDRAAMIALPPDLRPRYCSHLASLLPGGSRGLLITLDYPEQDFSGPPFAVSDAEVERNHGDRFRLQRLAHGALPAEGRLHDRGLRHGTESVFSLERR